MANTVTAGGKTYDMTNDESRAQFVKDAQNNLFSSGPGGSYVSAALNGSGYNPSRAATGSTSSGSTSSGTGNPYLQTTQGNNVAGSASPTDSSGNPFADALKNFQSNFKEFTPLQGTEAETFDPLLNPTRAFMSAMNASGVDPAAPNAGADTLLARRDLADKIFALQSILNPGQVGAYTDPAAYKNYYTGNGGMFGNFNNLMGANTAQSMLTQLLGTSPKANSAAGLARTGLETDASTLSDLLSTLGTAGIAPLFSKGIGDYLQRLVASTYSNAGALQGAGGDLVSAVLNRLGNR